MKKIVYFLLFALCLPIGLLAQSVDDDLYFVPSKDKQEKKETPVKKETKQQVTNIYTSPGTTVVVQDRKGKTRDVDEYNRRYDARDNEFVMDNDTLYIKEKSNPDLDGEWVTGEFDGTQEDYEYAERIIRFRNPRFAISISSPLYWDSAECQQHIAEIRQRKNASYLFQLKYLKDQIKECKLKFWHDGFANFDDMNLIACRCLRDKTICHNISHKFPVILIDECQDLSASELRILSFLISAGTTVHYIGDLHQAIYSFKDSCPKLLLDHLTTHHFETMRLSQNFRSTQKIVDLSRIIGRIDYPISGSVEGKCKGYDCCYIEYDEDEKDATAAFIDILNRFGISSENAVVLVRTKSAKQELSNGFSNDHKTHPVINAIQLWQQNEPVARQTALSLLGYQLQRWMGFHGKSNNYYYSDEVCPNAVSWRLLLRNILVELCSDPAMTTVDELTYGSWYSKNKERVIGVIAHHLNTIGQSLPEITIRTPNGTAKQQICRIILTEEEQMRVETIHSVKGGTFDAVLLLSSPDGRGKTGFWESWLDSEDESGRIGYVASTRPRYLLCWGVHTLTLQRYRRL